MKRNKEKREETVRENDEKVKGREIDAEEMLNPPRVTEREREREREKKKRKRKRKRETGEIQHKRSKYPHSLVLSLSYEIAPFPGAERVVHATIARQGAALPHCPLPWQPQ